MSGMVARYWANVSLDGNNCPSCDVYAIKSWWCFRQSLDEILRYYSWSIYSYNSYGTFPKEFLFLVMLPFIVLTVYTAGVSPRYSYAGTLSGITLVIIILNKNPSLQVAILRATEIYLGIAIALVVNRFVYPIRAETRLK